VDEMQLVEGETRYQIAWHYKIPYPRLHNLPTGTITDSPQRISKPTYEVFSAPYIPFLIMFKILLWRASEILLSAFLISLNTLKIGKIRKLSLLITSVNLDLQIPSQDMGSLDEDPDTVPGLDGSRRMFHGL
jgi:hypothetical protein